MSLDASRTVPNFRTGEAGLLLIYLLSLGGGAGRNAVLYANILASNGHKVALVCGNNKSEGLERDLDPRVTLYLLGVRRNAFAVAGLFRLLRRLDPAKVLVIGPSNMLPFNLAAWAAAFRGKVTLRVSNAPEAMQTLYSPLVRWFKRCTFAWALPRADRVIALTRALTQELERVWHVPPARIIYIPNGVRIPKSLPQRCPKYPPILLCVARLAAQKDHDTLLRAFAILHRTRVCRLDLAGAGPERARLEDLARGLGIAQDVRFLGHVGNVEPLYADASLTVLSSRFEGFPNVLIEALAQGCPIVATDCPTGPAEIIDRPEIGLLAKPGNPEDLAACLKQALDMQFDPACLRARAEAFSEDKLVERVRDLFEESTSAGSVSK